MEDDFGTTGTVTSNTVTTSSTTGEFDDADWDNWEPTDSEWTVTNEGEW